MKTRLILFVTLLPAIVLAQTNPVVQPIRQWRIAHERAILDEFVTLLAIPNVTSDRKNIQRNADLLTRMLVKRGVAAKLVTPKNGNPLAIALPSVVGPKVYRGAGFNHQPSLPT